MKLVLCVVSDTTTESAAHSFCDRDRHASKGGVSDNSVSKVVSFARPCKKALCQNIDSIDGQLVHVDGQAFYNFIFFMGL